MMRRVRSIPVGLRCTAGHNSKWDELLDQIGWWIPSVWAAEQTIREIYLKAFEIAGKDATKTIKYTSDEEYTVSEKNMRKCAAKLHPENYKQKR
jgi:beta-glucosidase